MSVSRASRSDRSRAETSGATAVASPEPTLLRFRVADMDCASCLGRIEGRLRKVDGVTAVQGSPVARTLTVEVDASRVGSDRIRDEVGRLGYLARPAERGDEGGFRRVTWTGREARIAFASMGLFGLALLLRALEVNPALFELPFRTLLLADVIFVAAAAVGGWNFFPRGVKAAQALSLDMNFLMTVAILGAVGIGEYMEGAAIAFLFAFADLLERYSVDRARASVEALMELAPDAARVIRDGREIRVAADDLVPGDLVVLRPGDRIPADGVVEEGTSAVNQAPITGESMPVTRTPGDELFAGTINQDGFLRMRVARRAAESALSRIIRLVEAAESRKTRSERFVERFARYYTPTVTVAAVALMVVPPLLFGAPFATWFVRGLTLLVIACPCALVISTPVAVVSGITAAARNGVLIKGGTYLEAMGRVKVLALDKTGTVTAGHPRVEGIHVTDGMSEEEVLALAAAVEARSEHPIARAIVEAAGSTSADHGPSAWSVSDFQAVPGRGARARLDGVEYVVGNPEFLASEGALGVGAEVGVLDEDVGEGGMGVSEDGIGRGEASREALRRLGIPAQLHRGPGSFVGVAREGRILGWISVSDPPRPGAAEAVQALRNAGVERVVLLTGDRRATGEDVGRRLGVDEVRAGLLPEDKVDALKELEARYGPVAMVGDGVNDAPALAAASVGIAMGAAGSDTALETADIALMGDDLSRLEYLYVLSNRGGRVIRQNIAAAIGVKALLAIGVPLGMVSLIAAVVVGDLGVSLAVTLNALRLAHLKPDHQKPDPPEPPIHRATRQPAGQCRPALTGQP